MLALLLVCLVGCSGAGQSVDRQAPSTLRRTLPTSSKKHVVATVEDALLVRYGYRIERSETALEDVRLESSWKFGVVTAEEAALGFTDARTRIIVTARPRSRGATVEQMSYVPRFVAELSGRRGDMVDWIDMPLTPEREKELRQIVDYLDNEFKAGVR